MYKKEGIDNVSTSIGIMSFLKQVLILACIFASCNSQGAPWSEEETTIIYKKVEKTINFSTSGMVRNRYLQLHPEAPNYHPKTNPNPPKVTIFHKKTWAFWGRWGWMTIDVVFWGCDLEILQLFLKVWLLKKDLCTTNGSKVLIYLTLLYLLLH